MRLGNIFPGTSEPRICVIAVDPNRRMRYRCRYGSHLYCGDVMESVVRNTFVYVISGGGIFSKVGIAENPAKRLEALQTGSAFQLTLQHTFQAPSRSHALVIERMTHRILHERVAYGEWFEVPPEDAVQAVEQAVIDSKKASRTDDFGDLKSWRMAMGFSCMKASEVLGCSKTSILAWERRQSVPRYIALACAAIAYGLPPMGTSGDIEKGKDR